MITGRRLVQIAVGDIVLYQPSYSDMEMWGFIEVKAGSRTIPDTVLFSAVIMNLEDDFYDTALLRIKTPKGVVHRSAQYGKSVGEWREGLPY